MGYDCNNLAGHNSRIYWVEEATPGVTPNNSSAWRELGALQDLTPTFTANEEKVTGVGSRRYQARLDGKLQTGFKATYKPQYHEDNFLKMMEFALGLATGTSEGRLKTFSLEAVTRRDTPAFFLANLYNGSKLRSWTLNWTYGQAIQLALDAVCQYVQPSLVSSGSPNYYTTYTGFQDRTIAGRQTGPLTRPYSFEDIPRPQIDYGAGLGDLPSVESMALTFGNTIVEVPGQVTGDDAVVLAVPECQAEEGQDISLSLNITPRTLDAYQRMIARTHLIDELLLTVVHPPGASVTSTDISLKNGGWDNADMSIKELVLTKQPLTASFKDVEVLTS